LAAEDSGISLLDRVADNSDEASAGLEGGSRPTGLTFVPSNLPATFEDAFTRPDGSIGNGWAEKSPGVMALSGGSVVQTTRGASYTDSTLLRPTSAVDIELAVTLTFSSDVASWGYLFARAVDSPPGLTSYGLQLNGASVSLAVMHAGLNEAGVGFGSSGTLAHSDFAAPLPPGSVYRLYLRVTGIDPVSLDGAVFRADGTPIVSLSAQDASSGRIVEPGNFGVGAVAVGTRWDDFRETDLP
jgi:hypothetical protein